MAKAPKDDMSKVADAVRDFLEDLTKSAEKTAKLAQQDPDAKQIRTLQAELRAIEQMTKCKRCSATLRGISRSGWVLGCPEPRHQFIDAILRPPIHEAGQQVGKVGVRIDAVQLTGLDQRG